MPIGFLALLAIDLLLFVASALLAPKPKLKGVSPQFPDRPTSKEGDPIPVLWGTVLVPANVTHFSDVTALEQTEKIKTGIFSSHNVTVGYTYGAIFQVLLGHGPIDELIDIIWQDILSLKGDKQTTGPQNVAGVWQLVTTTTPFTTPTLPLLRSSDVTPDNGVHFAVQADELFGGYKHGGGVVGSVRIYWGTLGQTSDDTLKAVIPAVIGSPNNPNYAGIAHLVFGEWFDGIPPILFKFFFGEFGTVPPLAVLVRRCPSALGLSESITNINGGANPAECIYEVMTNMVWGEMIPTTEIDTSSFITAANTLAAEEFGMNLALTQESSGDEIITEILRYIDGNVQQNPLTGLIELTLNRADYTIGSLVLLDDTNSSATVTRPSWTAAVNQVKVTYTAQKGNKWATTTTQPIDDLAAQREFGVVHSMTLPFPGIQDPVLANRVAVRELRKVATPLQRATIKTNRRAAGLKVGAPFRLTSAASGVNNHVFRVVSINFGTRVDGEISIEAIEDIFNLESPFYNTPIDPPDAWVGVGPVGNVNVVATTTNDGATGSLEITTSGGNGLATAIQFREQSGTAAVTAWHDNTDATRFYQEVDLDERHPSLIGWRVLGHLKDGSIGVLAEGEANFPVGTFPNAPKLSYFNNPDGFADLIIDVDQDTDKIRWIVSYDHMPTFEEVITLDDTDVPTGDTRYTVTNAAFLDTVNPGAYAAVLAIDSNGNASKLATVTMNVPNPQNFALPAPTFGTITVEDTAEDGAFEGRMHIPITFEKNTEYILIYASQAVHSGSPPEPKIAENYLAHTVLRHEGDIASADDWTTEVDIATKATWDRRIYCIPFGPTGLRGEAFSYFAQMADSGTPPSAPPSVILPTSITVSGKVQFTVNWTNGDSSSESRLWRNGIVIKRFAAGFSGPFVDNGLTPGLEYIYRVQHIKNGQTTALAGGQGTGGTPTLVAPTWQSSYPRGDGYESFPNNGRVRLQFDNPDPLAMTDVYMTNADNEFGSYGLVWTFDAGSHGGRLYAEDMPGGDAGNTDERRWFKLKARREFYSDSAFSTAKSGVFGTGV